VKYVNALKSQPDEPIDAVPGSPAKIAALSQRAAARQGLFGIEDGNGS